MSNFWTTDLGKRLREGYKARRAQDVWPKRKDGSLTIAGQRQAFDYVVGAITALHEAGIDAPVGAAFVASVRGADEVMLKDYEAEEASTRKEGYLYSPENCPSKHYNRGDDICADCGEYLS